LRKIKKLRCFFVETAGKEYEIIKYLENSPSTDEIVSLLKKLASSGGVSSPKKKRFG
jgi:arsenate reductase-like glutaredoxin family protein